MKFGPFRSHRSSGFSRRDVLRLGLIGSGSLAVPFRGAFAARPGERSVAFHNLHTGESVKTIFWQDGAYVPEALREIDHVLRDFRTGEVKTIDPALLDLLHDLAVRLECGGRPFGVISGYRSPTTNAALHEKSRGVALKSFHTRGKAIDIRLDGCSLKNLHRAALALRRGGVGYYPASNFVHVDTGPVRRWG